MSSPPKYQRYRELGGIINEKDYESALLRAENTTALDTVITKQSEIIARVAGIDLYDTEDDLDPITVLYGVLRTDVRPEKVRHHHSQMSDQRLFAEALRMLGDVEALDKLIHAHPNISFDYSRGDGK